MEGNWGGVRANRQLLGKLVGDDFPFFEKKVGGKKKEGKNGAFQHEPEEPATQEQRTDTKYKKRHWGERDFTRRFPEPT